MAEEAYVAHFFLVAAEVPLAAERDLHRAAGGAFCRDEVHQGGELPVGKRHVGGGRRAADRDDGEDAPLRDAEALQQPVDFLQLAEVAAVHAGHDVEIESRGAGGEGDGLQGVRETPGPAAHPVVGRFQPVKADGQGAEARVEQFPLFLLRVEPAV